MDELLEQAKVRFAELIKTGAGQGDDVIVTREPERIGSVIVANLVTVCSEGHALASRYSYSPFYDAWSEDRSMCLAYDDVLAAMDMFNRGLATFGKPEVQA